MLTAKIITGDCIEGLRTLPDGIARCCVTSPPYFGLRDYGCEGQIGLEHSPEAYVARMVEVFREVRRVLRDDGTLWLNLGDSYAGSGKGGNPPDSQHQKQRTNAGSLVGQSARDATRTMTAMMDWCFDLKPKDLVGIPWRVAFALQADGWWLRQDIIWHKPNPMPESVRDRCTKAHEYVFLMTKRERYYYDAEAVREPCSYVAKTYSTSCGKITMQDAAVSAGQSSRRMTQDERKRYVEQGRNRRSVWTITTKPYSGAHFAVMPPDLVEPCIMAGSAPHDTVIDPFTGSGTTGMVAKSLDRNFIGTELNPEYAEMARKRIESVPASMFAACADNNETTAA